MIPEIVSHDLRAQTLDELVKDEVTAGARVDHRDRVSAVLARGSERVLVTVDEGGTVHVDRLAGPRPRRLAYVALGVAAVLLIVLLLIQLDIIPV